MPLVPFSPPRLLGQDLDGRLRRAAPAEELGERLKEADETQWSVLCFVRCPLLLVAFLLLVVRPGATSSVLAPSSKARIY